MPWKTLLLCFLMFFPLGPADAADTPVVIDKNTQEPESATTNRKFRDVSPYPATTPADHACPNRRILMAELQECPVGEGIGDHLRYYRNGLPEQWADYSQRKRREFYGTAPTEKDMSLLPPKGMVGSVGIVQRNFDNRENPQNTTAAP